MIVVPFHTRDIIMHTKRTKLISESLNFFTCRTHMWIGCHLAFDVQNKRYQRETGEGGLVADNASMSSFFSMNC